MVNYVEGMTVNIETCVNKACGKKFSYTEIGGGMPGTKDTEECTCPYCGTTAFTSRIGGVFISSKIKQDDE